MAKIVTRFAPSPTGLLHAGNYRTALFSYLFARQHGGSFVLRIEDTDKARSKKEYEDNILESLEWLGFNYDQFYRQSDRTQIHQQYIEKLIASGHAYVSKETPKEAGGRTEVIRFKNPNKKVVFHDLIRGDIESDTTELGDFIIAKSLTEPVFHLVVVVDDYEMSITHIIRGEDHISNTTRHILIQEAIGAPQPIYAHVPLILAPDRSKLSKRKGALPITYYRDQGYLPEAMINFLALIGWNPGSDQEILSLDDLLKQFSLDKVHKAGAILNQDKLSWLNKHYIGKLSVDEYIAQCKKFLPDLTPDDKLFANIMNVLRDRLTHFGELAMMRDAGEFDYFIAEPTYPNPAAIVWKKDTKEVTSALMIETLELLKTIPEANFDEPTIKVALTPLADAKGKGSILWPLRYALSGKDKSPDPFSLAAILGKAVTCARLEKARNALV